MTKLLSRWVLVIIDKIITNKYLISIFCDKMVFKVKKMKNKIITVVLLLLGALLTGCNNKNEILKIADLEKYKNISISEIKSIEVEYMTLMPDKLIINEQYKIQNIYEALGSIELVKVSNMRTLDAEMIIRVITDNKKETYNFELNNYEYDDNTQYETKNISKLKELLKDELNSKITLKLQHFDLSLEKTEDDIQYEKTMVIKNESINISGIKFENIDKGMLSVYQNKYRKVIEYVKKKYPSFDATKWNIMVNMFAVGDGNGIIKFNYQIKDIVDTNKSIVFTINNNIINKVSFINMDFETNEEELIKLVNNFKNKTIQEKKEFLENEEFLSEDITYSYRYNTDELIYTYQLYFYQQHGENPEDRVINNEYGTEYIINKKLLQLEL